MVDISMSVAVSRDCFEGQGVPSLTQVLHTSDPHLHFTTQWDPLDHLGIWIELDLV